MVSCGVGDLSLTISCLVGDCFVGEVLSVSCLSASCLSASCRVTSEKASIIDYLRNHSVFEITIMIMTWYPLISPTESTVSTIV